MIWLNSTDKSFKTFRLSSKLQEINRQTINTSSDLLSNFLPIYSHFIIPHVHKILKRLRNLIIKIKSAHLNFFNTSRFIDL